MAAMKPRTGNGPMEAVEESRKIVMRIPSDGGGRLVVEMSKEEAGELGQLLSLAVPGMEHLWLWRARALRRRIDRLTRGLGQRVEGCR